MNVCGIVAEFDPFHSGHAYLIGEVRRMLGADTAVIAVMSGNFVQRGAPACFDKFVRARAALLCGVDLVIELPAAAALSSAEKFTLGGVRALADCGAATHMAFGSECGDIAWLWQAESAVSKLAAEEIAPYLSRGMTFAAARQAAASDRFFGEFDGVLQSPNDILALGYLHALRALGKDRALGNDREITPIAVARKGAGHGEQAAGGGITSASHIRSLIAAGEDFAPFLPQNIAEMLTDQARANHISEKNADIAVLSRLRGMSAEDFARLADVSEGLHNRLYSAVQKAGSLSELYALVKTKRYTHARIRRLVYCAALGIFEPPSPQYLRVLGFSPRGGELLRTIGERGSLPVVASYADAKRCGEAAARQFEESGAYTDFYNLLLEEARPCGEEYRQAVVRI